MSCQDDGGASVSHYVVEQRDCPSDTWRTVSKFNRGTRVEVSGLEEGAKYEFRVSAANEHGQGEPLVTARPVTAKHAFGESLDGYIFKYTFYYFYFSFFSIF